MLSVHVHVTSASKFAELRYLVDGTCDTAERCPVLQSTTELPRAKVGLRINDIGKVVFGNIPSTPQKYQPSFSKHETADAYGKEAT